MTTPIQTAAQLREHLDERRRMDERFKTLEDALAPVFDHLEHDEVLTLSPVLCGASPLYTRDGLPLKVVDAAALMERYLTDLEDDPLDGIAAADSVWSVPEVRVEGATAAEVQAALKVGMEGDDDDEVEAVLKRLRKFGEAGLIHSCGRPGQKMAWIKGRPEIYSYGPNDLAALLDLEVMYSPPPPIEPAPLDSVNAMSLLITDRIEAPEGGGIIDPPGVMAAEVDAAVARGMEGDEPTASWRDRLVFDPLISGDWPTVMGVQANHIVEEIVDGYTWAQIRGMRPGITDADIRACLAYACERDRLLSAEEDAIEPDPLDGIEADLAAAEAELEVDGLTVAEVEAAAVVGMEGDEDGERDAIEAVLERLGKLGLGTIDTIGPRNGFSDWIAWVSSPATPGTGKGSTELAALLNLESKLSPATLCPACTGSGISPDTLDGPEPEPDPFAAYNLVAKAPEDQRPDDPAEWGLEVDTVTRQQVETLVPTIANLCRENGLDACVYEHRLKACSAADTAAAAEPAAIAVYNDHDDDFDF